MSALHDKHEEFQDMQSRWDLCGALFEGEHGVHEEGETYLPRLQGEDDKAYEARKAMTPVFGAFPRTVLGLRGMMFRKPMKVELPATVAEMAKDIDLASTTLQGLAQSVTEAALVMGRVGLLVDYPKAPEGATKADAIALNLRPMIVKYDTKSIYNWRTERINGVTVTSQVRLEEEKEVQDPEDEFKIKCEKRYRVLDLFEGKYRQRVYKIVDNVEIIEDEFFPQMNGKPLSYIPFIGISVDSIGLDVEAPPLIDLATTVLHHYQQATSYERGCFFSGLPMFNIFGVNPQNADGTELEISIGGNVANIFPRADAHAEMLEVASKFEALRTNLEDKKREMAVLGARMLESQKAGVEAADAIARRMSGEESLLSIMAQTISMGLTRALQIFSDWASATGDVSVELNRDFLPAGITPQEAVAYMQLRDGAAISAETLFDNLKAGEVIASDVTFEQEQERIASSTIGMTPPEAEAVPATTEPTAEPAIDMQPLYDALATIAENQAELSTAMASVLNRAAIDYSHEKLPADKCDETVSLVESLRALGQQNSDALAAILAEVSKPVEPQVITVNTGDVNVPPTIINMPAQPITVNAGDVSVPAATVNVTVPEQLPANVTVNNLQPEGKKAITVERDASGKIIGATAE